MNFDSLLHAANHFAHMAFEMIEADAHAGGHIGSGALGGGVSGHGILAEGAEIVRKEIAGALEGANVFGLAPLSAATIARKGTDDYLHDTGALAASLRVSVDDHEARVGSDDPKIEWLEFGTSKMPPRPVFLSAAKVAEPKVHTMAAAHFIEAMKA